MRYLVTSVIPGIGEADCGELYCEDPDRDCVELWRRALMTCLIGKTDNHMRNSASSWARAAGASLLSSMSIQLP